MRALRGVVCLLLAGAASAQEPVAAPDAAPRELQAVQDIWARATAEFEGPQQGRSVVLFDDIIGRLESLRRQGQLPPRGREILGQSYELRGRAYFNIGLQEKAADSFRSLAFHCPLMISDTA